jgi:predicted transcriptional regulator
MTVYLTDAEWKIMNLLWSHDELTITQLTSALADETAWSKQTIISFLNRLEAKAAVSFVRKGQAKVFFALIERETTAANETKDLIDKVFSGSLGLMVNTIAKNRNFSSAEIKELEDIVKKMEAVPPSEEGK